jgi:hypothetical protein
MTAFRAYGALGLCAAAMTAGCMTSPNNGDVDTQLDIRNATLSPEGFYPNPGTNLSIQILSSGAADPSVAANWQTFATATSSTTPRYFFPGDVPSAGNSPLYAWSTGPALPVLATANWPQGGVARVRAYDGTYSTATFDSNWTSCPTTANTYGQFATQCESYAGYAVLVSSTPTPADNEAPPAGRWLSTYYTDPTTSGTLAYYASIGAGPGGPLGSLSAFQSYFHFGTPGDVSAVYYNNGDLGLGRSMHCRTSGTATACYVSNFADHNAAGNPIFGGTPAQQQDAIAQAGAATNPVATVAMVYDPTAPAAQTVKFIVYAGSNPPPGLAPGDPQPFAALDNHAANGLPGSNTAVPTNCMACHGGGGSYVAATQVVSGAHFLPFDVGSFVFAPEGSPYTQAAQQDSFQQLNELVYNAGATPAVQEMLQAIYGSSGPVAGSAASASFAAVPGGWTGSWHQRELYTNVVAPYCRTCHTSRGAGDPLAFDTYAHFDGVQGDILTQTCVNQDMPHSEQAQRNFWSSGARAHLIAWSGATGACSPN